MSKVLLLSIIIAMIAVPVLSARDGNARRALKKTLLFMLVFNLIYLFAVRFLYHRLI